jgi:translation initiation factor 2B subunit (eIF-2B alpha/beta/delta family)
MERHSAGRLAQGILKDLRADVNSGATGIARKAVQCLNAFADEGHPSAEAFWRDLVGLGKALIGSQPSMASVFNLVNQVLLAVEPLRLSSSVMALQAATREKASQILRASDAALEAIAQHGQSLINSNSTVFTHSSSNTVGGIFRQAVRQGKSFQALVTESRPYCEGREMARFLGQQGIETRLILDAAIVQYVQQADLILVGVDRVSEDSFVNKVGTLALAMAAKQAQVPIYAACESSKVLPAAFTPHEELLDNSEESTQEEWQNVELVYSFFEQVPNSYITGVITEEGILSMNTLSKRFKSFRLCQELIQKTAVAP